jgi:hypothetical protein
MAGAELERLGLYREATPEERRRWFAEQFFSPLAEGPVTRSKATAADWRARGEYVDGLNDLQIQNRLQLPTRRPPPSTPAGDQCRAAAELLERAGVRCLEELEEAGQRGW